MTPDDDELKTLLSRMAGGDRAAFTRLYDVMASRLYGLSVSLLGRTDLAEEALQEAFIQIWHNAGEYHQERGSPRAWMAAITRYRSLSLIRQQRELQGEDAWFEGVADERPGPQGLVCQQSEDAQLQGCMEQLALPQQETLRLAYYQGFSHDELAQRLETPLGTIKSWVRRGLLSLKRCMEQ
ncbi:MAG: sigma-70 family RNA polymerase sigma factor [Hahellaceae bacterium]|nr:sigma-70 family RNA polymerase sigma factor [Hahellaceae bacterium]